ncbi:hypothetical protein B6U84_00010 [Candidatus Bathyarchaeota archaeon ex4484_40]|nr:MAG: hypothetical protein B6U84_00010 [Candidatus Bathyarchaeota archaeon ex4484_40]
MAPLPYVTLAKAENRSGTLLEEWSDYIFTGVVVSVESKWVNTTEIRTIYSYATILVEEYHKSEGIEPPYVTLVYRGGRVNNIGMTCYRYPWGAIWCSPGQRIKAYAVKYAKAYEGIGDDGVSRSSPSLWALDVELLDEGADATSEAGSWPLWPIHETQGLGFAFYGKCWDRSDIPVGYYINRNGTEDIDGLDEVDEIIKSFDAWSSVTLQVMEFKFLGLTDKSPLNRVDGINVVGWVMMTDKPEDKKIVAYCWVTWMYEPLPNLRIVEFNIVFNEYHNWTIGSKPDAFDVRNICTHEVGHALELGDLELEENEEQTMWSPKDDPLKGRGEVKRRSLESGDIAGIRHIYPEYPPPSVTIFDPQNGEVLAPVDITASVSSGDGILSVQFKVHIVGGDGYDSGWQPMEHIGDNLWTGTWTASGAPVGESFWITVRAKSGKGIYGYDYRDVILVGYFF